MAVMRIALCLAVLVSCACVTEAFAPMAGAPLALGRGLSRAVSSRTPASALGLRMQQQGGGAPALERLIATMPYVLPLADGFEWGRYVFEQVPLAALPFVPLFPVMKLLNAPFVSFGLFIVLFSFVTRNPNLSVGATTGIPPAIGVPLTNTVFYAMLFSVGYAAYKNAQGQYPNEIPLISESVDSQMPF